MNRIPEASETVNHQPADQRVTCIQGQDVGAGAIGQIRVGDLDQDIRVVAGRQSVLAGAGLRVPVDRHGLRQVRQGRQRRDGLNAAARDIEADDVRRAAGNWVRVGVEDGRRSDPLPESLVLVTTRGFVSNAETSAGLENSLVSPAGLVNVAVINWPTVNGPVTSIEPRLTKPVPLLIVTSPEDRVLPSTKPERSATLYIEVQSRVPLPLPWNSPFTVSVPFW